MLGLLRGYMDESYDGAAIPKLFNLSCVVTHTTQWFYFEIEWAKLLESRNRDLDLQGRQQISRFHASDFSSSLGEFAGWSREEKNKFTANFIDVFRRFSFHVYGASIPLQMLVEEIPETKPNPIGFGYVLLMYYIMDELCKGTMAVHHEMVSLHHDSGPYDAVLDDAFNQKINDPAYKCRQRFLRLARDTWQNCIPLQAADFLAYENYKDVLNHLESMPRPRRKSLELFLDLDEIRGRSFSFNRETIQELKAKMAVMDEETKSILLTTARVQKRKQKMPK